MDFGFYVACGPDGAGTAGVNGAAGPCMERRPAEAISMPGPAPVHNQGTGDSRISRPHYSNTNDYW